jgi:hypothetical protein
LAGKVVEHGFKHQSHGRVAVDLVRRRDDSIQQRGQHINAVANTKSLQ